MAQTRRLLVIAISLLVVPATDSVARADSAQPAGLHAAAQRPLVRRAGWMSSGANPRHPWLYVAGYGNDVVAIYDLALWGAPLIGEITDGIKEPSGMKLDAQGNLYVGNYGSNTVTVYAAGETTPSLTLSQGVAGPVDLAVDADGDVYVCNRTASPPNIAVYPPGESAPSQTITGSLIQHPMAAAFDTAGNLYYSDYLTGISELPYHASSLSSLGLQGFSHTQGVAVDPLGGALFVNIDSTKKHSQETAVYAAGDVAPRRLLSGGAVDGDALTIGRVKGAEYVFESISQTNQVIVYKHRSEKPYTTLATASANVEGLALKPAGIP
jgi:DNA-binding beta-propeller fold protein YncE